MGKHGQDDRGHRNNYGRRDERDPRMRGGPAYYDAPPRLPRNVPITVILAGLVVWSLLAWAGYALVDPVLTWVAANAGLLVDSGKGIATAVGAGKEVGAVVDNLKVSGFLGQTIALLRVVLKVGIVAVWAFGALALVAAPFILPKLERLLGSRRH